MHQRSRPRRRLVGYRTGTLARSSSLPARSSSVRWWWARCWSWPPAWSSTLRCWLARLWWAGSSWLMRSYSARLWWVARLWWPQAVVGGAVTVGWVVAPTVEGAVVGVVLPTVAGAWAVVGPVVVVGLLPARRPGFPVVEGGGAVVVVDADVGADCVGNVGCATPGTRRGGSGWGSRVAEATMAASTAVVSPKTNNSSLQGRRGVARCRGGGVGMVHRPGLTCSFRLKGVRGSCTLTGHKGRGSAHRIERYVPVSPGTSAACPADDLRGSAQLPGSYLR